MVNYQVCALRSATSEHPGGFAFCWLPSTVKPEKDQTAFLIRSFPFDTTYEPNDICMQITGSVRPCKYSVWHVIKSSHNDPVCESGVPATQAS